jgi:deoxyribodipyrimidine photo-lyase
VDGSELSVPFLLLRGDPQQSMLRFIQQEQIGCVVCDFDPLRIKRRWFDGAAASAQVAFIEVDGHNIVPCRFASPKREYGAYTLRPSCEEC